METRLPRRFVPGERVSRRVLVALDALDGPVALKIAAAADPARARELARELERLAGLDHPAFPRAGSFGFLPDGRAWMSMERASGELPVGPMPWADLARLADSLCEALSYLHARGLAHRDLKPDHVRFDAATGRVMLLDLGSVTSLQSQGARVGTPGYVAPEIVAGLEADARADLHSLGAVLFELASGKPAFAGRAADVLKAQREGAFESLSQLRADAPPAFVRLVARLLSPEPSARPSSADACREMIARALGTVPAGRDGGPPVMGRDRETDALLELAERARHAPVAAVLAGPPGSGRTALLEMLRCRLLLDGVPVIRRSARNGSPLQGLARAIAMALDAPIDVTMGEPLNETLAALATAVEDLATRESLRGPVALLFDEADLAGSDARAEIAALARAIPANVLLLIADEPRTDDLSRALPYRVDLGPLSEQVVRHLLEAALRGEPADHLAGAALATSRQPGDVLAVARPDVVAGRRPASCADPEDPQALMRAGRIPAAVAAWQARLSSPACADPSPRARALAGLGNALWAMAEPADALARAEAAVALAADCGDPAAEAEAARVLGRIYGSFGSTRDGVGWQRRALELAAENPGLPRQAALTELGFLMIREGHVEAAMRALTDAAQEADASGDAGGAALARARLGRARFVTGDLGAADRMLRRAVAEAASAGDRIAEVEARRLLGTACCSRGELDEGLALLEQALATAVESGFLQEIPPLHEALAQANLRRAVRLRTPTGAIVDRRRLEVARAHVDKGLDVALCTGRMADRAALTVLHARCALLLADARRAHDAAEEAHVLALEAGDLLVASLARLVKAEALLDLREFGVALAEARIACEALERSGDLENTWRARALLARIHGAWSMGAKQEKETEAAAKILRRLESSLKEPRDRRAYLADVERAAALAPPVASDSARARRGQVPELEGTRFAGRADTEDLVEALIQSRHRIEALERRLRGARHVVRDARVRRDALLCASALGAGGGAPRSHDMARVLDLVSRACCGARVMLVTPMGGRLRVRGMSGGRSGVESAAREAALVIARRVVDTGRGSLALGAVGRRRSDEPTGEVHVALPLDAGAGTLGALVVRPAEGRVLRRADARLLRAIAPLLALALTPEPAAAPEERKTTAV